MFLSFGGLLSKSDVPPRPKRRQTGPNCSPGGPGLAEVPASGHGRPAAGLSLDLYRNNQLRLQPDLEGGGWVRGTKGSVFPEPQGHELPRVSASVRRPRVSTLANKPAHLISKGYFFTEGKLPNLSAP